MIDETVRKEVALEYCRRVNAGNLPLLRLFAVDVRFEDPVGTPPVIGRTALGAHFARVLAGRAEELPGRPIPAQDGLHVAVPIVATMDYVPVGHDLAAAGLVTPPRSPSAGGCASICSPSCGWTTSG
ncbi:nuclear transport factor 2 family protein [Thermocatellispora tengchongensis]|uniref:hypothetical protein n=1 Tax=Thermocatellispora tengchongensis TaxID=1073253 RepID=UPI00362F1EEB